MLNKISIRFKFVFVFIVIFIAFAVVGAFTSISLNQIGDRVEYSYQNDTLSFMSVFAMNQSLNKMAVIAHEMQLTFDPDELDELNSEFTENAETLLGEAKSFKNKLASTKESRSTSAATLVSVDEYDTEVESILSKSQEFISIIPKMVDAAKSEDSQGVVECDELIMPLLDDIAESMANLVAHSQTDISSSNESIHNVISSSILITIGMFIVFFIIGAIIAVFIIRSVTVPIAHLIVGAKKVASGDLNINMQSNGSDEVSVLSNAFSQIIDIISGLIREISQMSDKHKLGETEHVIFADKYDNSFKELAEGLNGMVLEYVKESSIIADAVHHLAFGDFTHNIGDFQGKKALVTNSVKDLKNQLYKLNNDIAMLSDKAAVGNLGDRITESAYEGDWSKLVAGLNTLLDRVSEPITETSHVLSEHAKGNLSYSVTGNYSGEFLNLKNSINSSSKTIHSYVAEISQTLKELANNDLNQKITREYIGDFDIIKTTLNNIFIKLNDVMSEIRVASGQVETSATQMAQASEALSEGSSTQAVTVSELVNIVERIYKIAAENESYAKQADTISKESTQNANAGSDEMKDMLTAMKNINESSGNIQKIIKTIEDIAFQTNLLALNASVEAARAGEQGKGFAVVADEVRTLAGRSAVAAKETSELITDSLSKIALGEKIAASTAGALSSIVENVNHVSELISKITVASSEQSKALASINEKLNQINSVVQNTSATAEETAAAASELTMQSHKLNDLVLTFRLHQKK